jgi:hypothetical protein
LPETQFSERSADSIFRTEGIGANQKTKHNTKERKNIFVKYKKIRPVKQHLPMKSIAEIQKQRSINYNCGCV